MGIEKESLETRDVLGKICVSAGLVEEVWLE